MVAVEDEHDLELRVQQLLKMPIEDSVMTVCALFEANVGCVCDDGLVQPARGIDTNSRASRQVSELGVTPYLLDDALGEALDAHRAAARKGARPRAVYQEVRTHALSDAWHGLFRMRRADQRVGKSWLLERR